MPNILPRSSLPRNFFFSHLPAFVETLACGTDRAIDSISASVCSATETAVAAGRVHHQHTRLSSRRKIDVIDAHASTSDDAQFRSFRQNLFIHLDSAANHQRIAIGQVFEISLRVGNKPDSILFGRAKDPAPLEPAAPLQQFSFDFLSGLICSQLRCLFADQLCFGQRRLCVDFLHRRHTSSEFHRVTFGGQDDFEFRDNGKKVGKVEIAEMSQAEDFALHGTLPVGDDGIEARSEFLHDDARIHTGGRQNGGNGRAGL